MNTLEHLQSLAEPMLAAGEEPLAAVRVNYNGTVQSNALGTNPTIGGVADPDEAGPDPDALVSFPVAKQMALLLTGGRVLAWSLGFSGKPKQYVGQAPLTAMRQVHAGEIRFGPLVRIVMKSHAAVDLEIMRGEDADGFIAELEHLVNGDVAAAPAEPAASAAEEAPAPAVGTDGDGADQAGGDAEPSGEQPTGA
ncbi:MAG: hypothetical protein U0Q07_19065 [Acidimicrobiales bacterium]